MFVVGYLVLAGHRWIRHRSPTIAAVLATGIVIRVGAGLTLFWISYVGLPIAQSLQSGVGFWELAVDARRYYDIAALAVDRGSFALNAVAPSPFFVWILTLWMGAVGVSPVAGMFLNLCLYVALVVSVVWCFAPVNDWRRDLPCIAFVSAYSFSPVILIYSTQPLKDELFNVVLAVACLGVMAIRRLMNGPREWRHQWPTLAGAATIATATFAAAGIRWYYGFMLWCSLAVLLAIFAVRERAMPLPRYLFGSFALLIAVWLGFWGGAGNEYWVVSGLRTPAQFSVATQLARVGFLMSGGNTNVIVPFHDDADTGYSRYEDLLAARRTSAGAEDRNAAQQAYFASKLQEQIAAEQAYCAETGVTLSASGRALPRCTRQAPSPPPETQITTPTDPATPPTDPAARAVPVTLREQFTALATGLAVVFVPISLLQSVSAVEIQGGRGLLSIVDIDTIRPRYDEPACARTVVAPTPHDPRSPAPCRFWPATLRPLCHPPGIRRHQFWGIIYKG